MSPLSFGVAIVPSVLLLVGTAPAQDAPAESPRPSIADQMVRQVLERVPVRPPVVRVGEQIGSGDGPLALLLRRADGVLEISALERATKDRPAPAPVPPAVEEVEIEEVSGVPDTVRVETAASAPVHVAILRVDGELRIGRQGELVPVGRERLDADALAAALGALRGDGADAPTTALLAAPADVRLGDVVAVVAAARTRGFTQVMLSGGAPLRLVAPQQETIDNATDSLGWEPTQAARGPMPALHGGELLLLMDGDLRWGEALSIYVRCMENGIWRLAFVAVDADGKRFKIPLPVPVDGA